VLRRYALRPVPSRRPVLTHAPRRAVLLLCVLLYVSLRVRRTHPFFQVPRNSAATASCDQSALTTTSPAFILRLARIDSTLALTS
jgi:hypothetical protein